MISEGIVSEVNCTLLFSSPSTFEKAMAVITEGAGKHFDPKVVEAFSHIAADLCDERTRQEVPQET